VFTIIEALKHLKIPVKGSTAAVQGCGNVGSFAARILSESGIRVVAISDSKGGVVKPNGLDCDRVLRYKEEHGTLKDFPEGDFIDNRDLLELDCTVLVPSALSEVITAENAGRLKCRLLAEGANGPTTPEADRILESRGIFILPDVLANSGGVIVSYFEWVQDLQQYFWKDDEVRRKLHEIITSAFHRVLARSMGKKVGMRIAAQMEGIEKIAQAHRLRGLYP